MWLFVLCVASAFRYAVRSSRAVYLRTELVLHGASVNPRAYGIKVDGEAQAEDGVPRRRRHGLNVFKRTANYLYKNPVHMVGEQLYFRECLYHWCLFRYLVSTGILRTSGFCEIGDGGRLKEMFRFWNYHASPHFTTATEEDEP